MAWSRLPVQLVWSQAPRQRVDLGVGQVGDQVALGPLGRDGEHPLDGGGVLGVVQGQVGEQGVDGGPAGCCGWRRCVPDGLEVAQERGDERRVELCDVEGGGALAVRWAAKPAGAGKLGLVGADRVGAGGAAADQAVGEEACRPGCEALNGCAPKRASEAFGPPGSSAGGGGPIPVQVRPGF